MDMAPGPGALGLGPWAQAQEAYFPYILVQIGLFPGPGRPGSRLPGPGPGPLQPIYTIVYIGCIGPVQGLAPAGLPRCRLG